MGRLDILVNAAGGNPRGPTLGEGAPALDMPEDAFREVVDLNLVGTLLPSQVFGAAMTSGAIAEVSSMAAARAITWVVGYAAANARGREPHPVARLELALAVRVNAVAPGFFVGGQNRRLLVDERDELTAGAARSSTARPAGGSVSRGADRHGDLALRPGRELRHRHIVPVDAGFSAFSGV